MAKRGRISGAVKRDVWLKYVGDKAKTKCFCCKKNEIMTFSSLHNTWQAGHILSHKNGGKAEIINLHPICKQCNNNMNDENWDQYVDRHTNLYHSWEWRIENYYKDCEEGIKWWQSLFRMHRVRKCFLHVPGNVFIRQKEIKKIK